MELRDLEPKAPFKFFIELSAIPRGSGDEKAASDYIYAFAKAKGLEAWQDEALNVIVKKPGTAGYENSPRVIVQGHMDMVCEKNGGTVHDFTKDGLKLVIDGDFLRADGTTLGADNGVAVAYAMALLDADDIPHPPLTAVFTTGEEVGLIGAAKLDPVHLKAERLINMDSGGDGIFSVGCAGGARTVLSLKGPFGQLPSGYKLFNIDVTGLKGGHSGGDIGKERANANKLLGRILYHLNKDYQILLSEFNGGEKENAIPREASAVIAVPSAQENGFTKDAAAFIKGIKDEYNVSDPGIKVDIKAAEDRAGVFDREMTDKVLRTLMAVPCGLMHMEQALPEFIETSVSVGVVRTSPEENLVNIYASVRSSVYGRKHEIVENLEVIAAMAGAEFVMNNEYPAWKFRKDSEFRDICAKTYKDLYGKEPELVAVHGGLECGLFSEKEPKLDIVAFGPDMYDYHSPEERLSISSFGRTWELLKAVMANLKN